MRSELLSQLIEDFSKQNKKIWALKKVKTIHPLIESLVRELAKLEPIKFIKLTDNEVIASSEIEGAKRKNPVAKPFHPTAIGVHVIYDFQFKNLEFYELNSAVKGWGEKMVKAVLNNLPKGWKATLVFDYSDGFWEKIRKKYNQVEWLLI